MNEPVDVFLVAGQSNAVGTGDPTEAPTPPSGAAYEYLTTDDELVALAEPVGPEDGASPWAVFTCEYHDRTDRTVSSFRNQSGAPRYIQTRTSAPDTGAEVGATAVGRSNP